MVGNCDVAVLASGFASPEDSECNILPKIFSKFVRNSWECACFEHGVSGILGIRCDYKIKSWKPGKSIIILAC